MASTGAFFFIAGLLLSNLFYQEEREFFRHNDSMIAELRILGELKVKILGPEILNSPSLEEKLEVFGKWQNNILDMLHSYEKLITPDENIAFGEQFKRDLPEFKGMFLASASPWHSLTQKWEDLLEKAIVRELEEIASDRKKMEVSLHERAWIMILGGLAIVVGFLATGLLLSEHLTRVIQLLTQTMTAYHEKQAIQWPTVDARWSKEEKAWLHSLTSLIAKIEASEKHRLQLYRFLVHDLNGAINSQSLSLQIFHKRSAHLASNSDDLESLIQSIDSMQKQIEHMVKDLYDSQNLQSENLKVLSEAINLLDLVEAWELSYQNVFLHWKCSVALNIAETLNIKGNPYLLTRVLQNLVHNCLRYLPNGQGRIEVEAFELDHETIRMTFKDNGSGISPQLRSEVFNEGFSDHRWPQSKGLGLSFCHQALKLMQGKIHLAPELDVTMFYIDLPKA